MVPSALGCGRPRPIWLTPIWFVVHAEIPWPPGVSVGLRSPTYRLSVRVRVELPPWQVSTVLRRWKDRERRAFHESQRCQSVETLHLHFHRKPLAPAARCSSSIDARSTGLLRAARGGREMSMRLGRWLREVIALRRAVHVFVGGRVRLGRIRAEVTGLSSV